MTDDELLEALFAALPSNVYVLPSWAPWALAVAREERAAA